MARDKRAKAEQVVEKYSKNSQFENEIDTHGAGGNIQLRKTEGTQQVFAWELSKVRGEGFRVYYVDMDNGKIVMEPDN